ncbi:sushi, von Willebrand factor type A, EGF and pentraxin domain-containing protein 1-like [Apostichopus japonicus]|uniref:sushi, von Willebrand factor type A, EGF and pentraxin domain-containing protein 1-like n=1 Tax=Stichopus japonicus TaxID=307972 RepID=UPI003AB5149D
MDAFYQIIFAIALSELSSLANENKVTFASCPGDMTFENDDKNSSLEVAFDEPVVDYNTDGTVNIEIDKPVDDKFEVGCTRVTYIATDDAGNTATCSFLVCVGSFSFTPGTILVIIAVAVAVVTVGCVIIVCKCK